MNGTRPHHDHQPLVLLIQDIEHPLPALDDCEIRSLGSREFCFEGARRDQPDHLFDMQILRRKHQFIIVTQRAGWKEKAAIALVTPDKTVSAGGTSLRLRANRSVVQSRAHVLVPSLN